MLVLKIGLYLLSLVNCQNAGQKDMVIIGEAINERTGAAVLSKDDGKLYYLDGVSRFDEKVDGEIIKVSGEISIGNNHVTGAKLVIQKPKWELTGLTYIEGGGKEEVVVIGRAFDAKAGAIVVGRNNYGYVDGLYRWDKKFYGKMVKLSGKLFIVINTPIRPGQPPRQQITGAQRIIKQARWQLVR